jgi:hypothetical protein
LESLILVDVLDAHGNLLSRQRFSLAPGGAPIVVGRDLASDVIVDDPYVAARHAELLRHEDGSLRITDLSEVNGIILGGERLRGVRLVPLAGEVRLGHSSLRIRSAAEPLSAELPDRESLHMRRRERALALGGALLGVAFAFAAAWVSAPDDWRLAFASNTAVGGLAVGAWLLVWLLIARFRRSRGRLATHAAIVLPAAALCLWLGWAADIAVFASGVLLLRELGVALQLMVVALAIYAHIRTVNWLPVPRAIVTALGIPAAVLAGYLWYDRVQQEDDVNHMPPFIRLFPPTWSRHNGVSIETFIDGTLVLRDAADNRRTAEEG